MLIIKVERVHKKLLYKVDFLLKLVLKRTNQIPVRVYSLSGRLQCHGGKPICQQRGCFTNDANDDWSGLY